MLSAWQTIATETDARYRKFLSACGNVGQSQFEVLMDILAINASAQVGKRHDFKSMRSVEAFRERVPVCNYDAISSDIDAQTRGAARLCAEPVQFYEETGGSTGGAKLVPYPHSALAAMQRAVEPWLADLVNTRPGIAGGASYWSVSPALGIQRRTADGSRIGSGSDLAFLREELQPAFAATLTLPDGALAAGSVDEWRRHTLMALVMEENLRLVSIWSPSFLTTLMDGLLECAEALQANLTGTAAARLAAATAEGQLDTRALWPSLDTISCWTHGPAAGQARDLAALFPQAVMQPKGLLATEGVVSIPLSEANAPVLAVRSGFFEFADDDERLLLADELEIGQTYRVIMTTYSGFYRYELGDTVIVRGHYGSAPTLEFIGRQGVVSDICGEKLNDAFVSRCLANVIGFATVAPRDRGYCLYVDGDAYSEAASRELASDVELQLAANPQYAYARRIGQLDPLQVVTVDNPADRVLRNRSAAGQSLGDIKPAALSLDRALHDYLGAKPE